MQKAPKKRIKHNYTDELELKSLLIRIKNDRINVGTLKNNNIIRKYIKRYIYIKENVDKLAEKYTDENFERLVTDDLTRVQIFNQAKRRIKDIRNHLKVRIVLLSEETRIDKPSYERFGAIIILMIKNILRKPGFANHYYKEDFYSDAYHKIIKYVYNFNHKLISKRSGYEVNAFAYISQIIHNSVIYIIKTRKRDYEKHLKHSESLHMNTIVQDEESHEESHEDILYRLQYIVPFSMAGKSLDMSYPFVVKDILQYIEHARAKEKTKTMEPDLLTDLISQYSFDVKLPIEFISDAIKTDEYFLALVKSEYTKRGKSQKEW